MALHLFQPTAFRHAAKFGKGPGHGGGGLFIGLGGGVAAQIAHDELDALGVKLGPDIIQRHAQKVVMGDHRQSHRIKPAARGADDGDLLQLQMRQQFQHVAAFNWKCVILPILVEIRTPSAPVIHADQAVIGQMWGEVVEIRAGAGEARKAEDRQAGAFVRVVKRQPVGGGEPRHQSPANAGMPLSSRN